MAPTPVRFPGELMVRADAISKSLGLSHAAVMRPAVNQWLEAGGEKSGIFANTKKGAKKGAASGLKKKSAS